jgi:hypothetical protein
MSGGDVNRIASSENSTTCGSGSGDVSAFPEIGRASNRVHGGTLGLSNRISKMVCWCGCVSGGHVGAVFCATTLSLAS